jgi:Asp-tRNA(Asn)/Glu-tRNA(Gln) amidotransferase A subunit family amidase
VSTAALTGTEAVAAVATGAASVTDAVAGCLDRAAELEDAIGAFRILDGDGARSTAKRLDGRVAGTLHGLVVGIKDVIDTADLPTGYGSPLFEDHRPARDAEVVAALRRAGSIVLGKTESTEFAMYRPTRTRNPWDLDRTPGGSSSGSAAAVAAGMVPVAFGTQTAGSVVRPAAYCGVYGFKPTRGWVSTSGIWRLSERLDTVGLFARSVADLALVYQVLQPGTARRSGHVPGKPTVAVLSGAEWDTCDGDVRDALGFVADRLSDRGWQVRDMSMPPPWRHLPEQHKVVMAAEVAKNLHASLGERVGQISEQALAVVEQGDRCRAVDYLTALEARDEALRILAPLAATIDLVLTPSALGVAPEGLGFTGDPVMCRPWTLLGLPAANVPAFRRTDGLPVGVQFVGLRRDDLGYLSQLALVEAALGRAEAAPTLDAPTPRKD